MLEEPLLRSSPWAPGSAYGLRRDSLFDDPFFNSPAFSRPAVDVTEEGNKYVVEADLPGVKKENVEVRIGDAGRSVTIEGKIFARQQNESGAAEQVQTTVDAQSSDAAATTGTRPFHSEPGEVEVDALLAESAITEKSSTSNQVSAERASAFGNTMFRRTVWLPRPVDSNNVVAKLSDGVLTITVPVAEDKASVAIPVQ
jgi:HSP20 family molecular chaperone IbpA